MLSNPREFCTKHSACLDGAHFAAKYRNLKEVWDACDRPDWMLWLLCKLGKGGVPSEAHTRALRLFTCWCAENTPGACKVVDWRARAALRTSRLFTNGNATARDLEVAQHLAQMSAKVSGQRYHEVVTNPVSCAAAVCGDGSYKDWAIWATWAWKYAVETVARTAGHDHAAAARKAARKAQADMLREYIPNPFSD